MLEITAAKRADIAERVGLHEQYLYQCFSGRRSLPTEHCPAVERATAGDVTCEALRPDVPWSRIPDPTWPHPAGRPVIDVARPVAAQEAA
jgi:DNA-binding transcriptional regulator YdaS (Cro superfamily)